jgi:glycine oxidase
MRAGQPSCNRHSPARRSKLRLYYNSLVKSWDAIIVGGGIIGLSLAISLRRRGLKVLVVERSQPGREASSAAAGMLAGSGAEIPAKLKGIAEQSARMYPEFVHELEDESGLKVDLRDQGTILISTDGTFPLSAEKLSRDKLQTLEPAIASEFTSLPAAYLAERSVDPRALVSATIKAAKHRSVDVSSGAEVTSIQVEKNCVTGVTTGHTTYPAPIVVNCAGAWAGCIGTQRFPVKPIKGQMLALVNAPAIKHVVRTEQVYLVPRSDGRLVVGSTLEDAGFKKQTDVETIQRLFDAAVQIVGALSAAKRHEDWAGLRPGTPDELPILGETDIQGYFVATGHYRDGILLAPVTAQIMTRLILHEPVPHDLLPFSPARFNS